MTGGNDANGKGGANKRPLRCAVYTRKSTEEGLEQEFNSLDAQRESCEAYIASQRSEGWVLVPDRFDDGGFTGANINRPALQRLLAKVEAKEIDSVVIYKLDRLTRSIRDFGRIMDVFERCGAGIVSVTQQMNTTTSMGRLMLHVLLSFAQFEREMTAERTKDKVQAARRKGKWTGGFVPLGYDLPKGEKRIVVNEGEALRVREIFRLYLETPSNTAIVTELNRRGWTTKCWTTQDGKEWGGRPWSKGTLVRLLSNRNYIGQVRHGKDFYPAEHEPIVDEELFKRVQETLGHGKKHCPHRNSFGYLLRGLVFCKACGSAMCAATTKKRGISYRYYRCTAVEKKGTDACSVRYAPAEPLEAFVVDHLRQLGKDPVLVEEAIGKAKEQIEAQTKALKAEERTLAKELKRVSQEGKRLSSDGRFGRERLGELEERASQIERRLSEIHVAVAQLEATAIDQEEARKALEAFDPAWEVLEPRERERLVRLVVERVEYDGAKGEIEVMFQPIGIASLAGESRGLYTKDDSTNSQHRQVIQGVA